MYEEEPGGGRRGPLPGVAGPQNRVQRRFVEQIIENFVPVQILGVSVLPVVMDGVQDWLMGHILMHDTEQEIEVPKISNPDRLSLLVVLSATQMAEQRAEVSVGVPDGLRSHCS